MRMNTVEADKVERNVHAVKQVRSLCDMHRVPFGTLENLGDLIASVKEDRHFAMDFWALVGRLSARESGELGDDEMLEVIVEGAAGAGVASLRPEERARAEELKQMLAGVDVAQPAELPHAMSEPAAALLGAQSSSQRTGGPGAAVVVLPEKPGREETPGTVREGTRARLAASEDVSAARRSIGEVLSRLERTTTELREQLAAIDEQIGKEQIGKPIDRQREEVESPKAPEQRGAEPVELRRLEEIAVTEPLPESVKVTSALRPPRSLASPRVPPLGQTEQTEQRRNDREREVFAPRPAGTLLHRGVAVLEEDDDPSIPVPLAGYAQENGGTAGRRVVAAVMLLALAGGGIFFARSNAGRAVMERYRPALHAQFDGVIRRLGVLKREATGRRDDTQNDTRKDATTGSGAAPAAPAPSVAPSHPAQDVPHNAPAVAPTIDAANATDAANASQSRRTSSGIGKAVAAPKTGTAARVEPRDREGRETDAGHRRVTEVASAPVGVGAVEDASVIKVAPSVMARHLVASRVPAYPVTAKAEGIEGRVVMEAVISKIGMVDHVRVIDGDRHLRSAAEEAVLKWRYRPYLLNGRPVDVATLVRVDFRLRGHNR
ncbi:energy transducer TonB [Edaphobacter bradus]|uniref:energy transducer TonB n=1 Tax=Edaphobacter bradus TaxID=2259016 RepID=UPI0021E0F39F|nr:energy transducer TonB [Edaphobacter bradus]